MADIFIEYKGRGIKERKIKTITTDNINSVTAEFKFDSEWDQYKTKVAIFAVNDCIAFKNYLDENNKCLVPWEALRKPKDISVSIVGFHEDKTYTSVLVPIRVHQGGDIDAESPSEPSMNIIAQIEALRAQVKSMNKELGQTQLEVEAVQKSVDTLIGTPDENGNTIIYLNGGRI